MNRTHAFFSAFFSWILLALSTVAAAAEPFSLVLSPELIHPHDQAGHEPCRECNDQTQLQSFLEKAEALLPPQMKAVIGRKITVRFTNELGASNASFQIPPCGPGAKMTNENDDSGVLQIRGRVATKLFQAAGDIDEIQLNAAMMPEILKGPERSAPYACGHKSLYHLALATLLHEISHIYDFSRAVTPERQRQIDDCENQQIERGETQSCNRILDKTRVVSNTPSFLSLMDWDDFSWTRLNESALRSPDPYEYASPEEEFAVNMEYFLLDPDYACRRPSEFEYLRDHFSYDPFPSRTCKMTTQVMLDSNTLGAAGSLVDLDPSRVYQIQFLFASQGPQLMSRWGHSMFRIIVCDPSRKTVGPECLNDIKSHVVVSYLANTGDWSVNALDGVFGNYPSQLFLYRFYPDIVTEYTVDEARELISLPLKFTEAEKTRFVNRVIEQYWEYSGKYYFFSNNCATEAQHLLKGVIRDYDFQQMSDLTPLGLYDDLNDRGYIDQSLVDDKAKAVQVGYDFPSQKSIYEGAYQRIQAVSPKEVPSESFDDYAASSDAKSRLALYWKLNHEFCSQTPSHFPNESKDGNATVCKDVAIRFFIVETYIAKQLSQQFMSALVAKAQKDPEMSKALAQMVSLNDSSQPQSDLTQAPRAGQGYGIPLAFPAMAISTSSGGSSALPQNVEIQKIFKELSDWAKRNLSSLTNESAQTQSNQKLFESEIAK